MIVLTTVKAVTKIVLNMRFCETKIKKISKTKFKNQKDFIMPVPLPPHDSTPITTYYLSTLIKAVNNLSANFLHCS